ncbi:hypothetical protein psal_cds_1236 [Pandoravirus salinus]|uniref:Uncharacterized protein n=1 Tax=Pandoravirus salinus TaxID=1349410 RepID=S4W5E0_9VIRU|nr:hypothetical protein psal_cds_1236 [Pandoravirus salinus]AGO85560.1 hypothetical protein psal_cds_1236 [Pandoravirus salinus]
MASPLLRGRARILSRWSDDKPVDDDGRLDDVDGHDRDDGEDVPLFSDHMDTTARGPWGVRAWCARVRNRAGNHLGVMAVWLSVAAAAYWMATLVPGLAVFALTVEIDDRPGGGPYTTKALLSIARAAAMPVGFAVALYGPVRRAAVDGWRRPVSLIVLPLVYSIVPNAAFAMGADTMTGVAVQLAARFAGTAVISLAFCAYLAYAQGRRASDVAMPVATLAILLAPAVSRPLSTGVANLLGAIGDGSDSDGHLWMPLAVSALCVPATLVAASCLAVTPLPSRADVRARSATPDAVHTAPVSSSTDGGEADGSADAVLLDARALASAVNGAWFRRHWAVVAGLAVSNAALQGLGAVRDVFTADLVGPDAPWWHSVVADAPACVAACLFYMPLLWVTNNRRAFAAIGIVGVVAALVLVATGAASLAGWLSPLAFLVVGGVGHFFALVPFSGGGIVFERLMGASHMPVDPLLLNVACQVPAYVAGLGVLLLAPAATHPAAFFDWTAVLCGGLLTVSCAWTLVAAFCVLPSPVASASALVGTSYTILIDRGDDDDSDDENGDDDGDDDDGGGGEKNSRAPSPMGASSPGPLHGRASAASGDIVLWNRGVDYAQPSHADVIVL